MTWEYEYQTPYQYADCDPIVYVDLDGLEGASALIPAVGNAFGQTQSLVGVVVTAVIPKVIVNGSVFSVKLVTIITKNTWNVLLFQSDQYGRAFRTWKRFKQQNPSPHCGQLPFLAS